MTTSQSTVTPTTAELATPSSDLTSIHWSALLLAAITGSIHVYLYFLEGWLPFLLAGLGFFGAIGLFFLLKQYRPYLYLAGIPYTAGQIVGYLLLPTGPLWLAGIDKAVQVAFIVALASLFVMERRHRPTGTTNRRT